MHEVVSRMQEVTGKDIPDAGMPRRSYSIATIPTLLFESAKVNKAHGLCVCAANDSYQSPIMVFFLNNKGQPYLKAVLPMTSYGIYQALFASFIVKFGLSLTEQEKPQVKELEFDGRKIKAYTFKHKSFQAKETPAVGKEQKIGAVVIQFLDLN